MKNSIPDDEYILITDQYKLDINSIEIDKKNGYPLKDEVIIINNWENMNIHIYQLLTLIDKRK